MFNIIFKLYNNIFDYENIYIIITSKQKPAQNANNNLYCVEKLN